MHIRRSKSLLALPVAAALVLAACGGDDDGDDETTTPATEAAVTTVAGGSTTPGSEAPGEAVSLAGDCPETVVIQTDWMPEAEHGFLYQMVGEGYEIDSGKGYVTGPLIDQNGNDTGVDIQIRSGGSAQNFQSVTDIMYLNEDILLGYVYTDEAIKYSATKPTVAIESGFEKNPQMIMWDPATYPDVETIEDLGKTDAKVRYFDGAAYMDYFVQAGILKESQIDGSYSGDSTLFIADEGKAAQQGFGSAEPYNYQEVLDGWKKPVKYQYINDAGWNNYAESIATKPENIETHAACFEKLVPIIQHASVDYLADPARTNAIVLDAAEAFSTNFGWVYTEGNVEFGVKVMKDDGLVANGPDGVMGKFDLERVNELIEKAIPIYTEQGNPPKEGLTAEDIVTNQFLDESIGIK
jgi:hypothetical protein